MWVFVCTESEPVWSDLAKFRHIGKILKVFGQILKALSFTNEVSERAKQMKEQSVVRGINFHIEKNLGMQNVCLSVWR